MAKNSDTSFAYEALVSIILPEGILNVFEVVNVEEEHTGLIEETGLERRIIHIHLDERDLRSKEWHDLHSNGFTEEHCINDFPIRDRKVVLHVRRRRWKDEDGKKGTLIAAIRGTKASVVVEYLMRIPEDKRLAVKEVTMDYSYSMYSIVTQVFPNADIVIDCFHVMKNQLDGLDAIRMRFKRKAKTACQLEVCTNRTA